MEPIGNGAQNCTDNSLKLEWLFMHTLKTALFKSQVYIPPFFVVQSWKCSELGVPSIVDYIHLKYMFWHSKNTNFLYTLTGYNVKWRGFFVISMQVHTRTLKI